MDGKWKTKQLTHEGFPLFIRYPKDDRSFSDRTLFPMLAVISHHFSKVTDDGLPEADYNDGLLAFDKSLREAFEFPRRGIPVLIETFAGKRNYYIYTIPNLNIDDVLASIVNLYPENKLSWLIRSDPEWGFIKRYSDKFLEAE